MRKLPGVLNGGAFPPRRTERARLILVVGSHELIFHPFRFHQDQQPHESLHAVVDPKLLKGESSRSRVKR